VRKLEGGRGEGRDATGTLSGTTTFPGPTSANPGAPKVSDSESSRRDTGGKKYDKGEGEEGGGGTDVVKKRGSHNLLLET